MLPSQYYHFSLLAGMGRIGNTYISRSTYSCACIVYEGCFLVYRHCGYIDIVAGIAEHSMQEAVREVKELDQDNKGEVELDNERYQ